MFDIQFSPTDEALCEYIDRRIAACEEAGIGWEYSQLVADFEDVRRLREVEEFRRREVEGKDKAEKRHDCLCSCGQCLEKNLARLFDSQDAHADRN